MAEEEEIITVNIQDKETGELIEQKKIRNNIFIDATKKYNPIKRIYLKCVEQLINSLLKHADKHLEHRTRFNRVHKYVKQFIVHRGLRLCERIIGKHLIRKVDDIPAEPHNNHQRIWLDSWFKAIDDMWTQHLYPQLAMNADKALVEKYKKMFPTPESYLTHTKKVNAASNKGRVLMGQLYITEVMEDTVDRTMSDCFVMRVTHEMMKFYGVKPEERAKVPVVGEYPVYLADKEKNKQYFIAFSRMPTWYPIDSKDQKIKDLEIENYELKFKLNKISKKTKKPVCESCKIQKEVK